MTFHATAKSKIFIGTTDRATTETEYEAETWTEIKETEDLGEFGATNEEITFSSVGDGHVRRRAGVTDSGRIELVCARDPSDPGQRLARAGVVNRQLHNFKVVLADQQTPTGAPSTFYFGAVVLSDRNNLGTANDITKTTFSIGIDGEILEIEAS